MKRRFILATVISMALALSASTTWAKGLQGDIDRAVNILQRFQQIPEKSIPKRVLRDAKGLAIITVGKAGFVFSGRGGSGLVVTRLNKGWSPPSAIGTGGAGFGLQIGAEVSELVLVLNTTSAVEAFSRGENVSLGTDLSVAAGPVGRTIEVGVLPVAAVYTYSRSQGLFAGVSLEGTVLAARNKTNAAYYGRAVTPAQILSGRVKAPAGAARLRRALARY